VNWKPIPGYEGLYEVSDCGLVRRFIGGRYKNRKLTIGSNGYLHLVLSKKNVKTTFSVHVLVLAAFVGPCPEDKECCHRDGDKLNNEVSNLYYGTKSQNWDDRRNHPQYKPNRKGVRLSAETRAKISASKTQTACKRGHKFTVGNTRLDSRGHQHCRLCERDRMRERRAG
jgi:hypothetical protein